MNWSRNSVKMAAKHSLPRKGTVPRAMMINLLGENMSCVIYRNACWPLRELKCCVLAYVTFPPKLAQYCINACYYQARSLSYKRVLQVTVMYIFTVTPSRSLYASMTCVDCTYYGYYCNETCFSQNFVKRRNGGHSIAPKTISANAASASP